MKEMVSDNLYQKEWEAIEDEKTQPRFLREVLVLRGRVHIETRLSQ